MKVIDKERDGSEMVIARGKKTTPGRKTGRGRRFYISQRCCIRSERAVGRKKDKGRKKKTKKKRLSVFFSSHIPAFPLSACLNLSLFSFLLLFLVRAASPAAVLIAAGYYLWKGKRREDMERTLAEKEKSGCPAAESDIFEGGDADGMRAHLFACVCVCGH